MMTTQWCARAGLDKQPARQKLVRTVGLEPADLAKSDRPSADRPIGSSGLMMRSDENHPKAVYGRAPR
ncbi:hypothetical protein FCULG_00008993 [Fusarium culmorum]|uniref:Uncharacterized protein n=1 Tax=Fusarium culmorum TaxID=5516 RepID=A0A2T4GGT9_FUSCU|nr:hypothetical protein FCULG_00008993 [Fusarium culmorum]